VWKILVCTISRSFYGREAWCVTCREEHRLSVFENRVLREIFGTKGDVLTVEWGRLHNQELYALHSSPNIIRVIQSRRMGLAGHVACIRSGEVHAGFWWGVQKERDHLKAY